MPKYEEIKNDLILQSIQREKRLELFQRKTKELGIPVYGTVTTIKPVERREVKDKK